MKCLRCQAVTPPRHEILRATIIKATHAANNIGTACIHSYDEARDNGQWRDEREFHLLVTDDTSGHVSISRLTHAWRTPIVRRTNTSRAVPARPPPIWEGGGAWQNAPLRESHPTGRVCFGEHRS